MIENLEYYKVFYYVGKNKSITAAAKELMISQPAVSQSIHQLEKALGCSLFKRTSRGMKFTAEGDLLYRYVERGVESIDLGQQWVVVAIDVIQTIAVVEQQCRQLGTVIGSDGLQSAEWRRHRVTRVVAREVIGVVIKVPSARAGSIHVGAHLGRKSDQCLWIIAAHLECTLSGIDIGDRVVVLHVQVVDGIAGDDERVEHVCHVIDKHSVLDAP
jgi:molybdenum-dependent DNA-binding transcriptional regulator ModE